MLSIDLPEDIQKRLASLSLNTGRTVQFYAREVIVEYLEEVEDRFLAMNGISEDQLQDEYGAEQKG